MNKVFIVVKKDGTVLGAFKKMDNAINSIPEKYRDNPKQISKNCYHYDNGGADYYSIYSLMIKDHNDLTPPMPL